MSGGLQKIRAEDPILFVSSFAGGDEGAIHAFQLNRETGALSSLAQTTEIEHPFFLALSPDHNFLYAIHAEKFGGAEDEDVAAFSVEGRSGKLTLLNRQSAKGSASCYLHVDATGQTVVVANYSSGSVAALPVKKDGSLGQAASFVQHEGGGSGVDLKRQNGPFAHSIVVSPGNRFAYAADLGLDKIFCYQLDPAAATLSSHSKQPFIETPPGSGPRHLSFHPNGKFLYAINELSNSVTVFDHDDPSGMLTMRQTISTLPDDFEGKSYCADLKITPDGNFLYGTNRGHDSIAVYRIGDDGGLTLLGIEPSRGKGPQNLAITSDGRWLLCANMPGNNLAVFRIDPKSGALEATGEPLEVTKPSCVLLME